MYMYLCTTYCCLKIIDSNYNSSDEEEIPTEKNPEPVAKKKNGKPIAKQNTIIY